jgi:hypothetical protein
MAFETPEEAYQAFLETGQYMNHGGHFTGTPEEQQAKFGAYKHMVPKDVKKGFRDKVDARENAAIEGMMAGESREGMGILNKKEEGQALYRRLGAGLKAGIDMNKAFDWGAGTAREVGTTDMANWGTNRAITPQERQRWQEFSGAGSPEAYWRTYRQNQINDLVARGAIAPDGRGGFYNPGPGGQQHYGANLEGYYLGGGPGGIAGAGPGGHGRGGPAPRVPTYSPGSYNSPYANQAPAMPAPPSPPTTPAQAPGTGAVHFTPPKPPASMTGSGIPGMERNSGITGGMSTKNPFGTISAANGYYNPVQPPGPLPDGGTPLIVHPDEEVSVTPAAQNPNIGGGFQAGPPPPNFPFPTAFARAGVGQNRPGTTNEIGPGQAGIPNNLPNGRSPFGSNPMPMPTGTGIVWGPNGPTSGGGGNLSPNLPGVNLPGQIPINQWGANTPWGSGLQGAGQMDNQGQQFELQRAMAEYAGSFGPEATLMRFFGGALGVDANGNPLQGQALDLANRQSFGQLAPQAERISGDTNAALERLKGLPQGGARERAQAEILGGAQSGMLGLRQDMQSQALQGMGEIMQMKKGFDPAAYQGGNQALLGAEVNTRGQDLSTLLGQRGQDIEGMLGQRGQDVQWGLGWGGLANSASQNLWDSYLTGRGQDLNQYMGARGQDLNYQAQQQAIRAQKDAQKSSWWSNLLGTVGTVAGGLVGGPPGAAIGGGAGRAAGGFSLGS